VGCLYSGLVYRVSRVVVPRGTTHRIIILFGVYPCDQPVAMILVRDTIVAKQWPIRITSHTLALATTPHTIPTINAFATRVLVWGATCIALFGIAIRDMVLADHMGMGRGVLTPHHVYRDGDFSPD
jgi:hypothetical protein